MPARTLYDKLWESHLVHESADGTALIYIDRHLVHEVTSPQAYAGLKLAGRKPWRVDSVVATADHNTPTRNWDKGIDGITDPVAEVRAIENELKGFDKSLLKRPRWLVFNKVDLLAPAEREQAAKAIVRALKWKQPWYMVSAIAREGTWPLCLDIQRFFDEQKLAAAEAARERGE